MPDIQKADNFEAPHRWSYENEATIQILSDQRVIVSLIFECDGAPPKIMFKTKGDLQCWAFRRGLKCSKIGEHKEDCALKVSGDYKANDGSQFHIDQVWVTARYYDYCKSQKDFSDLVYSCINLKSSGGMYAAELDDPDTMSPSQIIEKYGIDADHVINKKSLIDHQPDAWVLLFPVQISANRGFGAKIERGYPNVNPNTPSLDLTPEIAFKLFCGSMPKNMTEFEAAMRKVKGIIDCGTDLTRDFVATMEAILRQKFYKKTRISKSSQ